MNKGWTGDTADFTLVLKGFLNKSDLIVTLFIMCMMIYTNSSVAGNVGNSNKAASSNKTIIPWSSGSQRIVGTWGYPGVAGSGGYPGVAGYGGYYPSWRHTQSKSYSGIDGNKAYPGISGNKAYSGIAGSEGYPGIPGN